LAPKIICLDRSENEDQINNLCLSANIENLVKIGTVHFEIIGLQHNTCLTALCLDYPDEPAPER